MSSHSEFLSGFGDALGLNGLADIEFHYTRWRRETGMNPVELIDYESAGYMTGLETGAEYKLEHPDL